MYFKSHIALSAAFASRILHIFSPSTILHAIIYILRVFGAQRGVVLDNTWNIPASLQFYILVNFAAVSRQRQPF